MTTPDVDGQPVQAPGIPVNPESLVGSRRPVPGPNLLIRLARSRVGRWSRRHPAASSRLVPVLVLVVVIGVIAGCVAVAPYGTYFTVACSFTFSALVIRRTPFRHNITLAFRPLTWWAYRRAGVRFFCDAWLWAAGITPAGVRVLRGYGLGDTDVTTVAFTLVDKPHRSPALLFRLLAAQPDRVEETVNWLPGPLESLLTPDQVVAYWEAGVKPQQAAQMTEGNVPLDYYQAVGEPVGWLISPQRLIEMSPALTEDGVPADVLARWIPDFAALIQRSTRGDLGKAMGRALAVWWTAAGEEAPYWAAAGFTPQEAKAAYAAGDAPDRETLQAMAALRKPLA